MLTVVKNLRQLNFSDLMALYAEGNRENGEDFYPNLPPEEQLLQAEQDFYAYLSDCFFRTVGAAYCIWSENGRYVSALRLEPYQDGLLLEALETHPEHRRNGYAKKLISAALAQLDCGKVYVHIHKKNVPSIAVHEACGFHRILNHAIYADGSVLSNSYTYLYEKPTL